MFHSTNGIFGNAASLLFSDRQFNNSLRHPSLRHTGAWGRGFKMAIVQGGRKLRLV